jgi:2-haloacid dehalogenase
MTGPENVKLIIFDCFGTVVDWRGSIIEDLSKWGEQKGLSIDWALLADLWRGSYEPQMGRVRSGEIPWTNLDDLHFESLQAVLSELHAPELGQLDLMYINRVWHRLNPWPDAVEGLERLKRKFVIGPLSNANVSLLVNMAKFANLPWDHAFSCELYKHYKPDPETYLGVCRMMYLDPEEVMLCAAHNYDLVAARECGLRTAFIPRSTEYGPGQKTDLTAEQEWDIIASDLIEFATEMGA